MVSISVLDWVKLPTAKEPTTKALPISNFQDQLPTALAFGRWECLGSWLCGSWELSLLPQRRRRLQSWPHDPGELAALHQLSSFAAPAGDVVLGGADRLLCTAAGLDCHQVAIPR